MFKNIFYSLKRGENRVVIFLLKAITFLCQYYYNYDFFIRCYSVLLRFAKELPEQMEHGKGGTFLLWYFHYGRYHRVFPNRPDRPRVLQKSLLGSRLKHTTPARVFPRGSAWTPAGIVCFLQPRTQNGFPKSVASIITQLGSHKHFYVRKSLLRALFCNIK